MLRKMRWPIPFATLLVAALQAQTAPPACPSPPPNAGANCSGAQPCVAIRFGVNPDSAANNGITGDACIRLYALDTAGFNLDLVNGVVHIAPPAPPAVPAIPQVLHDTLQLGTCAGTATSCWVGFSVGSSGTLGGMIGPPLVNGTPAMSTCYSFTFASGSIPAMLQFTQPAPTGCLAPVAGALVEVWHF